MRTASSICSRRMAAWDAKASRSLFTSLLFPFAFAVSISMAVVVCSWSTLLSSSTNFSSNAFRLVDVQTNTARDSAALSNLRCSAESTVQNRSNVNV